MTMSVIQLLNAAYFITLISSYSPQLDYKIKNAIVVYIYLTGLYP